MLFLRWLCLFCGLLSCISSTLAAHKLELSTAQDMLSLNGHARVWIDTTGQASLMQAKEVFDQQPALPNTQLRDDNTTYDLHQKAMWIQFSAQTTHAGGHWRLQVSLPTTDLASLHYQRSDGSWVEAFGGDSLQHSRWTLNDRYPVFALSDELDSRVTYYLRVKHDRVPYSAHIFVATDEYILSKRQLENLILGVYFGILLSVTMVCIVYGFALRYMNYFRYALYVSVLGLSQFFYLGFGAQYFTPNWLHWNSVASFVLPYAAVAVALWLVRQLTRPAEFAPTLDLVLLVVGSVMAFLAVKETIWPSLLGFQVANAVMILCMVCLYLMLWRSARAGDRNAKWIALGFAPVVISAMFPVLRNFGVVSTGFLSQYAVTLGSAIEVPLLMYALMLRSASQRDMRVREQALLQQDALTGLADERRFLSKLHSSLLRARRFKHQLGVLHVQLQNHDHLAKEFGQQVANAALLLTASHLQNVGREIDLPCRLPGNEFVLLIEGPAKSTRLIEAATKLLAQSLRPSNALPVGSQPRLIISAALLPDATADGLGEDAQTQYFWLLEQVKYLNQVDPRKAIRSINF